jgi:hypothetical protein
LRRAKIWGVIKAKQIPLKESAVKKSIDAYVTVSEMTSALMQASFIDLACAFAAVDVAAATRALNQAEAFAFLAASHLAGAMPGAVHRDSLDETVDQIQRMIKLAQQELDASCDECN